MEMVTTLQGKGAVLRIAPDQRTYIIGERLNRSARLPTTMPRLLSSWYRRSIGP